MDKHPTHDLRENDLESFLGNLGDFWSRHGKVILITVLVVLAVLLFWQLRNRNIREQHDRQWENLSSATSPSAFMEVSRQTDGTARYMALTNAGQLWLERVAMPMLASSEESSPNETPENMLRSAAEAFEQVVQASDAPLPLRLEAMLGLAAVAEGRLQWDEAAKWYDKVAAEAGETFPVHKARAERRQALMDRLRAPVTFAPVTSAAGELQGPLSGELPLPGEVPMPVLPELNPEPVAPDAPAATPDETPADAEPVTPAPAAE